MSENYSRKQLYDLVWSQPMTKVAVQFGLSDRGLAKLCERHGIPVPPRGYWAKHAAGRSVKRPPLLSLEPSRPEPSIFVSKRATHAHGQPDSPTEPALALPDEIQEAIDRENSLEQHITVPDALRSPHRITAKWIERERRDRQSARSDPLLARLHRTSPAEEAVQKRRIRIIDALLKGLEARGFKVRTEHDYGHSPILVDHEVDTVTITVAERLSHQRRRLTEEEKQSRRYSEGQEWTQSASPTGELRLSIKHGGYGRDAEVADRPDLKLEQQLNAAIGEVIKGMWQAKKRRQEHQESERLRRAAEARRLEQQRIEKLDQSRKKHLLHMARRRRDAAEIRDYIQQVAAAVESNFLEAQVDEFAKWRSWALGVADELDPIASRKVFTSDGDVPDDGPERHLALDSYVRPSQPWFPTRPWYSR
jgi:hypothetical protein